MSRCTSIWDVVEEKNQFIFTHVVFVHLTWCKGLPPLSFYLDILRKAGAYFVILSKTFFGVTGTFLCGAKKEIGGGYRFKFRNFVKVGRMWRAFGR